MHEHSPDHTCGENELQIPDFASYQWEWMAGVPSFRDHYLSHDQTPHYRYMKDVLQALHFAEIVLSRAAKDPAALRVKLEAHELLLEDSGRENFSEVRWLEAEIRDTREVLS